MLVGLAQRVELGAARAGALAQSVPGITVPGVTASSGVAARVSTKSPLVTVISVMPENSLTRPLRMVTWSPIAGSG